jgi:hypothetical protein
MAENIGRLTDAQAYLLSTITGRGWYVEQTGGGCRALRLDSLDGHVLVTGLAVADLPAGVNAPCARSSYDLDGEQTGYRELPTVAAAISLGASR